MGARAGRVTLGPRPAAAAAAAVAAVARKEDPAAQNEAVMRGWCWEPAALG